MVLLERLGDPLQSWKKDRRSWVGLSPRSPFQMKERRIKMRKTQAWAQPEVNYFSSATTTGDSSKYLFNKQRSTFKSDVRDAKTSMILRKTNSVTWQYILRHVPFPQKWRNFFLEHCSILFREGKNHCTIQNFRQSKSWQYFSSLRKSIENSRRPWL